MLIPPLLDSGGGGFLVAILFSFESTVPSEIRYFLVPGCDGTIGLIINLPFLLEEDICPPAKAEIKDFHSRGQIPSFVLTV